MPSEPASPRLSWTSSSGFWPLVDRARRRPRRAPCRTSCGDLLGHAGQHPGVLAAHLDLDLLLVAPPKPLVKTRGVRAADRRQLAPQTACRRPSWLTAPLGLRHQSGRRLSAWSTAAGRIGTDGGVGVAPPPCAARADARRLLRLEPRVLEVRARRRLDDDDADLRLVASRARSPPPPNVACSAIAPTNDAVASATIDQPVVERPADQRLVAVRLAVEPGVERVERPRDAAAMRSRLQSAGPPSRPRASGRARRRRTATPAPSRRWSARTA